MQDSDETFQPSVPADPPCSPAGHRFMFVVLAILSFALFAPAVLLPRIRSFGELLVEEQKLKQRIAELNDEARRRAELEEAFSHDAIVNERLAVLDLGYHKPNEEVFSVIHDESISASQVPPMDVHPPRSALLIPDDWPTWTLNAERWAQQRGIVDLFLDESLRPVFLLMSGGLLVAAFVLFAPRIRLPRPIRPLPAEPDHDAHSLPHAVNHQPV
ncbi:MAG: hypothetical protein AABZ08_13000 [Planctomycetota bacterium]